ncbi:aminotransferase class-III family protein, partial [Vibrio parahaemolyticus V-223/04]
CLTVALSQSRTAAMCITPTTLNT